MSHFIPLFQLLLNCEENIIIIIHCIFSPTKDLVIIVLYLIQRGSARSQQSSTRVELSLCMYFLKLYGIRI